ncbi:Aldo/keto reductase [Cerioporus squamosus]|nr:Aldo/keto reductase [Cerioporus squamosus]
MALTKDTKLKLHDGNEIPILGFGTYEMEGEEAYNAVRWALEAGYRHIDSAEWYENEAECGRAILDFCKATGTPREEIFYTTKLKENKGFAHAKASAKKSLDACGLGYIDLYLIHSPIGGPQSRAENWKALIEAKKEGLVRSIGVSTYGLKHLQEMVDSGLELPVVNQIDLHPFMTRTEIVAFCRKHGIALEAWAPLVRGLRFRHPKIVALAEKYKKQPAQVLLRYSLQKGFVAIPKSSSKARIQSNLQLFDFELSDQEIADLDALDEYLVTDWDPTNTP